LPSEPARSSWEDSGGADSYFVEVNVIASALSDHFEKVASLPAPCNAESGWDISFSDAWFHFQRKFNRTTKRPTPSSARVASNRSDNGLSTVKPNTSNELVVALQSYFLVLPCARGRQPEPVTLHTSTGGQTGNVLNPSVVFFSKPGINETHCG